MRGQQISSYVMNGAVCEYTNSPPLKLGQMPPSGVAFWECANNTPLENQQLFNDGASSPDENTSTRHGSVTPYGAFDGSARIMNINVWEGDTAATNQNEMWCYPNSPNGR